MDRRDFFQWSAAALGAVGVAAAATRSRFDLEEATVADLTARLASGHDTALSLTRKYLARIHALDRGSGGVGSVIELNPDVEKIAAALDSERKAKGARGPLHGVPVLIKDNIDSADRMMTTAGSLALAGPPAPRDAFIVERLRAAGAVLLGKTNLSEWANFRSTHSVSGWSGRGGQTRNPYALDRNPCGSSSGSGAAVSANFCALAIGTETDGSVVCPSSVNGVVGIKPTVGLLSRSGIVPISHSQDTAGPMARTVRDAALLLSALAGVDERDSGTGASAGHAEADYTKFLAPGGLRGARLGVARKFTGYNTELDKLFDTLLDQIKQQGAEIIDPADFEADGMYAAENEVLHYEFKAGLNAYLAGRPNAPVHSLKDVIAFNQAHASKEMPWFAQELMLESEQKGPLTDRAYLDALAKSRKAAREDGIDAVVAKHRLDAIIAPTGGPAWLTDWLTGDHDTGGCSSPAAIAGYPHITVPAGFVHGLPVGMSFYGPAWSEPKLLKLAYSFEQFTKARRAPQFLETVVLTAPRT